MPYYRPTLIFILLAILLSFSAFPVSAQEPVKGPDPVSQTPPVRPVNLDPALLPKIEPQLLKNLLQADGDLVPFIVYMKQQADITGAVAAVSLNSQAEPDRDTKRQAMVDELKRTAQQSQAGVLRQLGAAPGLTGQARPGRAGAGQAGMVGRAWPPRLGRSGLAMSGRPGWPGRPGQVWPARPACPARSA